MAVKKREKREIADGAGHGRENWVWLRNMAESDREAIEPHLCDRWVPQEQGRAARRRARR